MIKDNDLLNVVDTCTGCSYLTHVKTCGKSSLPCELSMLKETGVPKENPQ